MWPNARQVEWPHNFPTKYWQGPLAVEPRTTTFWVSLQRMSPNFCSMTRTHSSASRGSSALTKSGGRVSEKSRYKVSRGPCGGTLSPCYWNWFPVISRKKRVLSAVALTKVAIASANVGGIGGGLGVSSRPRDVPALSCVRVLDGIWSKEIFGKNITCWYIPSFYITKM